MVKTKYQKFYVAYAKSQGRTPEAQNKHDKELPGSTMLGFMLWISEVKKEFVIEHPESIMNGSIIDLEAWKKFVIKYGEQEALKLEN